jgi:hypothetical protein
MKKLGVFALSALWCCVLSAGSTPAPVRAEVEALLAGLQASGCRFNRNGSWYSGGEAKAHLLRKLEAIEVKTTIASAEQFIELAASRSSASGKAYQVKCGGAAAVDSRQWLMRQLMSLRNAAGKGKP